MTGNNLANWSHSVAHGPGFDHNAKPWSLRLMGAGWVAWRAPASLVRTDTGGPRVFPSAAAGARYLEEHPDHDA